MLCGMKNEEGIILNGKTETKREIITKKTIKNIWVEYNEDE